MPPNVPRSRRWNHEPLTLTIETAPKLWKYMFAQYRTSIVWNGVPNSALFV